MLRPVPRARDGLLHRARLRGDQTRGAVQHRRRGRFDQLIERLGGPSVPACGFSIGFERIYTLMEEGNMFSGVARAADALIAVPRPEECAYALSLGSELRGAGLCDRCIPGSPKLVAQYEVAEQKRIPYVVVADSAQLPSGVRTLSVRTIATRTSVKIPEGEVASWLKNELGGPEAR